MKTRGRNGQSLSPDGEKKKNIKEIKRAGDVCCVSSDIFPRARMMHKQRIKWKGERR